MSTLLLSHKACLDHVTPPGHPERPDRLRAVEEALSHERFQFLVRDQAPEGDLAVGRLEVTFSNPQQLVDSESGPWARIKGGLSVGLTALSWSLTLVIVGLCFAVPLGLIGWVALKLYRKSKGTAAPAA